MILPIHRSWDKRLFYSFLRIAAQWISVSFFQMRVKGRSNFPSSGGGLVLSTHQSTFDPVLVGLTCNRRMNYLARKTLFKNSIFAKLIRYLDAIEIDREGGGLSGIRETIARLQRQELVLIFPEGTRTTNGEIGVLKTGFIAIARRAKVPLIPVAIVGAFEVLPKGKRLPILHPISVVVGDPIPPNQLEILNDQELMDLVLERMVQADRVARAIQAKS